jgi:hypothetical protein
MSFRDISFAGFLCLVLAPCLWGGNFVVGSLLAADLPGIWMNLMR